mmetsp:Transcript_15036/g.29309  ORF Transcript_15036/g.29309 Transcript_15036/m.29309 type:complete len:155 (+) Transcript_15036:865-1329(+)
MALRIWSKLSSDRTVTHHQQEIQGLPASSKSTRRSKHGRGGTVATKKQDKSGLSDVFTRTLLNKRHTIPRTVIKSIAIAALSARVVYFRATAGAIRAMKDVVNLHFPAQALVAGILRSCLCQSPRIALHSHSTSTTLNDKSGRTAELCKCSLSL